MMLWSQCVHFVIVINAVRVIIKHNLLVRGNYHYHNSAVQVIID